MLFSCYCRQKQAAAAMGDGQNESVPIKGPTVLAYGSTTQVIHNILFQMNIWNSLQNLQFYYLDLGSCVHVHEV